MLARRFTIVCLLMILFGMFFAILVAEAGRTRRPYTTTDALPCSLDRKISCPSVNQN
jgi:hypothetical protein